MKPATQGKAPSQWPAETGIVFAEGKSNLVLFAHPQCPCSRATMEELAVILTQSGGRMKAHVLFHEPPDAPPEWTRTDLWRTAAAMPGVEVRADRDGAIARRFGAEASGQVVLFSAAGEQLFAGGITGARGHQGDNAGRQAVLAVVEKGQSRKAETPVYGCPLTITSSREEIER
jgi:hypothetical protein